MSKLKDLASTIRTKDSGDNIVRLPMPDLYVPTATSRSLMVKVRIYFETLYNSPDKTFVDHLASVGNDDAIHKNRLFDRCHAVWMIKQLAEKANDTTVLAASEGEIYKCMTVIMRNHKTPMGLKVRRQAYKQLTQQQPAA